jgi:hypothetical protein
VVTDHLNYFRQIQRVIANSFGFMSVSFPRMAESDGELVGTNFEKKYIAQGRPFYHSTLMKYT